MAAAGQVSTVFQLESYASAGIDFDSHFDSDSEAVLETVTECERDLGVGAENRRTAVPKADRLGVSLSC